MLLNTGHGSGSCNFTDDNLCGYGDGDGQIKSWLRSVGEDYTTNGKF